MKLFEHPDFEQAIIQAAEHFRPQGLRAAVIEKDYYVTEALRSVATANLVKVTAAGSGGGDTGNISNTIIFKGGTSLSKGWNLIARFSEDIDIFLWRQDRNVPFWQSRNVPFISERSLSFPLARIVWLAAEPVKASLRRAQNLRAALTEPVASREPIFLTRGNESSWNCRRGTFLLCRGGGHFYFAATDRFG